MTVELQRCPNPWCFAMSAPVPVGLRNGNGNPCGWQVQCACGVHTFRADTKREAVAAWNNRTAVRLEGHLSADPRKHPLRPTIEAAVINSPAIQDHALSYRKAIASDVATDVIAMLPAPLNAGRPMSEAPRDKTPILARMAQLDDDSRWAHLSGRYFVIRHEGRTRSDFDLGWSVHPGLGGAPDQWFDVWFPLPGSAGQHPGAADA